MSGRFGAGARGDGAEASSSVVKLRAPALVGLGKIER
jgi:hypothetical protein